MNMLSSSPARAALVGGASGAAPASIDGIRDLLRDTALFVANLSTGGVIENFDNLRERCSGMVAAFSAALDRRSYPQDVRDDAVKAQCALLDETALHRLSENERPKWAAQPLQVEKFKEHDAGERVFERIEFRMRERSPQVDLLECYAAILGLGFLGRYAIDGRERRQALIAEINALIQRHRPEGGPSFIIDQPGRRFGEWFQRVSPWALAGLGCALALVVWLVWHVALDMQLAALVPQAVKP